ncbi:hypothetical protein [Chitinophaga nivalis]|uniref:Uncharacterized protein n=1 Tax=Chitinophaga nivalis TaxID=2991709 RepID=A0ABT3IUR7_9BACT|nr:hypothetical protein [Chitinophaga nivalis]MCW3462580.1 hypothetical protein [Chitinophaga nivalis]MCW3487729.1 hypothetical protein [Chitinophaga nivalis]
MKKLSFLLLAVIFFYACTKQSIQPAIPSPASPTTAQKQDDKKLQDPNKVLLYNFYSATYGHLFTTNSNYANDHPGWRRITGNDLIYVYNTQIGNSVPVYIMQHRTRAVYCLTTNNTIHLNEWATTGVADFYAFSSQVPGAVPVHQFYHSLNPAYGYFYDLTLNPVVNGWVENTVKFYAFNSPN